MKTVTICSSVRFEKKIKTTYRALLAAGYQVLSPERSGQFVLKPNDKQKIKLAKQHFQAMKDSDFIYFLAEEGYIGTSCKLELGYAIALDKPIYFSQRTGDVVLDAWAKEVIPVPKITTKPF